jgi:hypothetical protein
MLAEPTKYIMLCNASPGEGLLHKERGYYYEAYYTW